MSNLPPQVSPLLHYQLTAPPTPQLSFQTTPGLPPRDSIVESIVAKFQQRSAVGWTKYGTTLDREDLSVVDWIQHAQEELMDGILYLEKLKKVYGMGSNLQKLSTAGEPTVPATTATGLNTLDTSGAPSSS